MVLKAWSLDQQYHTPSNLLEMHIFRQDPIPTESEPLKLDPVTCVLTSLPKSAVPNLFGTRDRFPGRQFSHKQSWVRQWFRFHPLLTSCCAVWFEQARDPYRSVAWGLETPALGDSCLLKFENTWFKSYCSLMFKISEFRLFSTSGSRFLSYL